MKITINKRNLLIIVSSLALLLTPALGAIQTQTAKAAVGVRIEIDKKEITSADAAPFIKDGRTLVPLRMVSEGLGAEVTWKAETREVVILDMDTTIVLKINSNIINVNQKDQKMDSEAIIINNRTYVPVRFISEALGYSISWDGVNRLVSINTKDKVIANDSDFVAFTSPLNRDGSPDTFIQLGSPNEVTAGAGVYFEPMPAYLKEAFEDYKNYSPEKIVNNSSLMGGINSLRVSYESIYSDQFNEDVYLSLNVNEKKQYIVDFFKGFSKLLNSTMPTITFDDDFIFNELKRLDTGEVTINLNNVEFQEKFPLYGLASDYIKREYYKLPLSNDINSYSSAKFSVDYFSMGNYDPSKIKLKNGTYIYEGYGQLLLDYLNYIYEFDKGISYNYEILDKEKTLIIKL